MFPEVIDPENIAQKLIQSPDALFSVVASGYENHSKIIEIILHVITMFPMLREMHGYMVWTMALFGGLGPEVYESIEL